MRFRDDRRAAALQVGAILLLGFLVIGLALYQSTVVPDQNERVEFDHNQQVQGSLQDVRNGVLRTAAAERTSPTTVPLGARYPTRIAAVNPPPSSGRLATGSGGEVTLVNATAINDETADYWNGTNRSYASQRLTYDPEYSIYQNAPRTVYDDTVLYDEFDGGDRAVTDQRLLEGNLIYVVALNGSLARSGTQPVSVSPTPVSASSRTVAVNGSDMAIEVDTGLPESEWERLLEDQYESNGGRIAGDASGVTVSGDTLTVDLVSNRTYRLRMAKVGVGTGVTDTTERYLTVVGGADSVTTGGTRRIVLEVRDGYNNPVSGVPVDTSVNRSDASIQPSDAVSDGSGQVVFEYRAPDAVVGSARTDGLNFTFDTPANRPDFSGGEAESVRINVTVVTGGGGGAGGSGADSAEYVDGSVQTLGFKKAEVQFALRNTASRSVNVTQISVDSTGDSKAQSVSGSGTDPSVFTNRTGEVTTEITIGGSAESFSTPAQLPSGSETTFTIGPFVDGSDKRRNMQSNSITITVTFADGTSETISFTP